MKQRTFLFLLVLLSPLTTNAYDAKIDGIYYNFSEKEATVTYYLLSSSNRSGYGGSINIPETVMYSGKTYRVTSIGEYAFYYCSNLKSVTIPNSVTSLGQYSFRGCSDLATINIPNSVKSIGIGAFYSCSGLTSVNIPNSVTSLSRSVFAYCSGLTTVTIGNGLKSIGEDTFSGCTNLTSVTFGNSVETIGYYSFYRCSNLTSITIPNNVISIDEGAFYSCSGLSSVTIGNNVTSIGRDAFRGCSSLKSVTIPNSVTSIGSLAFYNCSGLASVTIGNSVKNIYDYAFANCSGLTDVYSYAENVPVTDDEAFNGSFMERITLYVPESSLNNYKNTWPWNYFGMIKTLRGETPEGQKCATPNITISDGRLIFDCETEGVEFVSHIEMPSSFDNYTSEVNMPTMTITVYAKKEGYEDSDIATMVISVGGGEAGVRGDVNLDGEIGMPDVMFIVNYILNGKFPDEK